MPARPLDAAHRGVFKFCLVGYYTDTSYGMLILSVISTMIITKPTRANITLQLIS